MSNTAKKPGLSALLRRLWPARDAVADLLAEADKLRRRAGRKLAAEANKAVRDAIAEVKAARDDDKGRDAAAARLQVLLERHLTQFRKPAWRESVESIGGAVLVALFLRCFVMEAFKIPSGSMIPTLAVGDQIFVNKYIYGPRLPFSTTRLVSFAYPKRGEVIVFVVPKEEHEDYIKRVVALPGDTVAVKDSIVYINGQAVPRIVQGDTEIWDRDGQSGPWWRAQAQAYTEILGDHSFTVLRDPRFPSSARDFGSYTVPPGHVFVMGDNRDHSEDSRVWGPVPLENLLGRAMFVWGTWGHAGITLERVGTWIE